MTNNQARFNQNMMTEKLRLEYLSEMQITSWELREPFKLPNLVCEDVTDNNRDELNGQLKVNEIEVVSTTVTPIKEKVLDSDTDSVDKMNNSPTDEIKKTVSLKPSSTISASSNLSSAKSEKNQYLNLVAWSSAKYTQIVPEQTGSYDSSTMIEKNILIICRHKIDQPANSFASKRGPSYFMQDYLKTLVEFGLQNNLRINIQLAHLAEAGLGESSITIKSYFEKQQPDFSLVLGDETVENLIDKSSDVKSLRCRLNKLSFNTNANAIVSYHPFDLISNPRLKSLAFEDIQFLINHLSHVGV